MKNLNYKLLNNQYTNLSNIRNILEITIIIVPYYECASMSERKQYNNRSLNNYYTNLLNNQYTNLSNIYKTLEITNI